MCDYPTDRKDCGYAFKYLKWVISSGAVNEIGPDAFAVLVAVVMCEDDIHYSRAPNFYNEQLMMRCGIGSEPALIRARQRAVQAGLLSYRQGAKRRPGTHFVCGFPNESLANVKRKRNESETNRLPSIPLPNTQNPKGIDFPENLNNERFRESWQEWVTHRAELKKRLTPSSTKKQLAALSDMGPDRAIDAINHSIKGGYQGIFEPNGNATNGKPTEAPTGRPKR